MAEKKKTVKSSKSRKPTKSTSRVRKPTKKQAKTTAKTEARVRSELPNSFKLTATVLYVIRQFWRPLLGIVLVYLVLNVLFASGLSSLSSAMGDIKANLNSGDQSVHPLAKGLSGFGSLVGSAGVSGSSSGSILQSVLFVIESLVIIWALRQLLAGKIVSVKEAYYHSTYPLIPFLLVVFVIIIELLPITLGTAVLSAVLTSAVSSVGVATWLGWIIFLILASWSFYMISGSIFALYIVTLPEVHPLEALRSAKQLVGYRRWQIIPKILFLPVFILAAMAVIVIPFILFASALAAPVFYVLGMLTILFVHTYLYSLYRSLL